MNLQITRLRNQILHLNINSSKQYVLTSWFKGGEGFSDEEIRKKEYIPKTGLFAFFKNYGVKKDVIVCRQEVTESLISEYVEQNIDDKSKRAEINSLIKNYSNAPYSAAVNKFFAEERLAEIKKQKEKHPAKEEKKPHAKTHRASKPRQEVILWKSEGKYYHSVLDAKTPVQVTASVEKDKYYINNKEVSVKGKSVSKAIITLNQSIEINKDAVPHKKEHKVII